MVTLYISAHVYPHRLREKPLGVQAREARVLVAVKEVVVEVVVPQYNKNLAPRWEPESSS